MINHNYLPQYLYYLYDLNLTIFKDGYFEDMRREIFNSLYEVESIIYELDSNMTLFKITFPPILLVIRLISKSSILFVCKVMATQK